MSIWLSFQGRLQVQILAAHLQAHPPLRVHRHLLQVRAAVLHHPQVAALSLQTALHRTLYSLQAVIDVL